MCKEKAGHDTGLNVKLALELVQSGLSIIPIRTDGSKSPCTKWKTYQSAIADETTVLDWFGEAFKGAGTAIVCGAISGGLEVIDFDHNAESVFPKFRSMVDTIICKLPVVETPGYGYHIYYRCHEICAGKKIAMENGKTVIESRGQGNTIAATISPAAVHPRNYPYVQVAGPSLPEIPTIAPFERRQLWEAAATFDRDGIRAKAIRKHSFASRSNKHRAKLRDSTNAVERARKYVGRIDSAISGADGHGATFKVACVLILGFALDMADAFNLMVEYNQRCEPPWSEQELRHKLTNAERQPGERGYLLESRLANVR